MYEKFPSKHYGTKTFRQVLQRIDEEYKEFYYARNDIDKVIEAGDVIFQISRLLHILEEKTGWPYQDLLKVAATKYRCRNKNGKNKDLERKMVYEKFYKT